MIVIYNDLGMYDFLDKFEDVYGFDFVNLVKCCYEFYCVWVVEVMVKQGMCYIVLKCFFYVDEDSWSYFGVVDYDVQGNILKVCEGYIILVYEMGSCDMFVFV